ncbi:MAG: ComF family protein [Lentisphaerae bacterium]|nr:ComF family protein [Lentisphaerota bacterium]
MQLPLLHHLLDLVYPRTCAACGREPGRGGRHVCWDCRTRMDILGGALCRVCGDPVEAETGHAFTCSSCAGHRPHFDLARSAARYRRPLNAVLQAFKYRSMACLAADLTPLLAACVGVHYGRVRFDALTYVPLHRLKERERTYNQAGLLARALSRLNGFPPVANCLRRVRPTPTQTGLSAFQRRANVRDAFRVTMPEWIRGRTVLLIDDVMTTGATVNECARVLRKAGASGVYVATVARG